jgi:hypothetical protein
MMKPSLAHPPAPPPTASPPPSCPTAPSPPKTAACVQHHLARSIGSISRAGRVLEALSLAPPTADMICRLMAAHSWEPTPCVPPAFAPTLVVTEATFQHFLERLPRGSALGLKGWTYENIRAATGSSPTATTTVLELMNFLLSDFLPDLLPLHASALLAPQKPEGATASSPSPLHLLLFLAGVPFLPSFSNNLYFATLAPLTWLRSPRRPPVGPSTPRAPTALPSSLGGRFTMRRPTSGPRSFRRSTRPSSPRPSWTPRGSTIDTSRSGGSQTC